MEANAQGLVAELMTREMGKPYTEAVGELLNVGSIFRYYAEVARDDGGFLAGPTSPGALQYAKYFPFGITAHIMPYNFPIILMAFTVAASLAVGNAVVIKPAPATSLCTLKFMEHFASLPPGLVSCLTGGAETAQALIADERVKVVAFTGSVEAGQKVAAACGERLKPCVIEAGGSDPLIVMDSADPDVAAAAAVTAAFHLSGQVCTATERILVHEKVHDAFVDRMVARTKELRVGPGLTNVEIGPLVSEAARDKVMRLVDQAVAQGAKVACGGKVPAGRNVGWFYEPTVLTGVTPDMAIVRAELFGPVAPVIKVRSLDEAIALANASRYGLGAAIYTNRLDEAMAATERLEAGMVWVNNVLGDNDALPFGGWKASGMGRALSRLGLNAFRQSKMVMLDPKAELQGWWYPYSEAFFKERGGDKVRQELTPFSLNLGGAAIRPPVPQQRQPHRRQHEGRDRPQVRPHFVGHVALQHHAADDAQEMRQRQDFADPLRPHRHAAEREHEAAQQQRRQEEEERQLHRLHLALGHGREGEADREIGRDEKDRRAEQQRQRADDRHVEQVVRRQHDDHHLHVADEDVGHDLAQHDLDRADRHGEQVLHGAALLLARHGKAGHHHHGHGQHDAHQAGHDVVLGDAFLVVAALDLQVERRRRVLQAARAGL